MDLKVSLDFLVLMKKKIAESLLSLKKMTSAVSDK